MVTGKRKLQLKELELLILFRDLCEKHDLTYYISGGTFLGAIRHKGFIPWDDDIDVAMPRKDYDQFVKIALEEISGEREFLHFSNNPESLRPNSRIVDYSFKILNNSWETPRKEPVWIDVFPLDGMPSSKILQSIHKCRLLYRKVLIGFANHENIQDNKPDRPFIERSLIQFNKITRIGKLLNVYSQYEKIEKLLRKYSNEKSDVYFNFHGAYRFKSILNIKKIYGEGRLVEFEGSYFNSPSNYDLYLTKIYGDYMKLPPEEERNKHNTEIVEY